MFNLTEGMDQAIESGSGLVQLGLNLAEVIWGTMHIRSSINKGLLCLSSDDIRDADSDSVMVCQLTLMEPSLYLLTPLCLL